MRVSKTKTSKHTTYYIIENVKVNGKRTTKTIEKLGTEEDILKKSKGLDADTWAREYCRTLTENIKEGKKISLTITQDKKIPINKQLIFNVGYLPLQNIYYKLGLDKICYSINQNYNYEFSLNNILSRLIYSRILFPNSKLGTFRDSDKFIENKNFELHDLYRSLDVLSKESDFIQSQLYKNSLLLSKRNTNVLYYDCTNFFFEINEASGLKQFGMSKEHRPNPIVQMGLFMDGDGIPLAYSINKGNTNEQITLRPLEQRIIKDFELSKFIVCTDAGLASAKNKAFNSIGNRAFITTQSIKKLKKDLKEWALDLEDWNGPSRKYSYDLDSVIDAIEQSEDENEVNSLYNHVYFKERVIKDKGVMQKLIVTFSYKYFMYQRKIREKQINRAEILINKYPGKITKKGPNDPKRFIKNTKTTENGEIAEENNLEIDIDAINKEAMYDGFYAITTNLDSDVKEIIKVNKQRWEIEDCFRVMKSEFKARPVYLQKDNRIEAHFLTCFISLVIAKIIKRDLNSTYSTEQIISELKNFNITNFSGIGYVPSFNNTVLLNEIMKNYSLDLDTEFISNKKIKKNISNSKITHFI